MTRRRGDVVLVAFPYTDLMHYKLRPALVVQSDDLATDHDTHLVALITSNLRRVGKTRIRVNVLSDAGRRMGLRQDSVVVVDHIATIRSREMRSVLGRCPLMMAVDGSSRRVRLTTAIGRSRSGTSPSS